MSWTDYVESYEHMNIWSIYTEGNIQFIKNIERDDQEDLGLEI